MKSIIVSLYAGVSGYGRFAIVCLLGLVSSHLHAQQEIPGYLSVIAENDIYAPRGQDRHYTNGVRVGIGLPPENQNAWYRWLGRLAGFDPYGLKQQYEFAFGQNIYTPEYYLGAGPIAGDRPYAGWLYGEWIVNSHRPDTTETLAVSIGMVGPVALAEQGQKLIHKLTGDAEPAGWNNQLHNEPALLLRYQRSWRFPLLKTEASHMDIIPRLGFKLGNVFTDAGAGAVFRVGNHLPEHDVVLRIQPGLSGASSYIPVRKQEFDWMLYAEIQGRAVARNIFLDGNTFRDSLSVDKRTFVRDLATGILLGIGHFDIPVFFSFSVVWRGPEFELQQGGDSFGSAMIGIQY